MSDKCGSPGNETAAERKALHNQDLSPINPMDCAGGGVSFGIDEVDHSPQCTTEAQNDGILPRHPPHIFMVLRPQGRAAP